MGFITRDEGKMSVYGLEVGLGKADPWHLLKMVCSDVTSCGLPYTV